MISNCPLNAKLRLMKVSCQCFRHIRVQLLCREWFCSLRSCLWMWQEVTYSSSSSSSSVSSLCLQSAEWRAAYKHLAEQLDCFFFFFLMRWTCSKQTPSMQRVLSWSRWTLSKKYVFNSRPDTLMITYARRSLSTLFNHCRAKCGKRPKSQRKCPGFGERDEYWEGGGLHFLHRVTSGLFSLLITTMNILPLLSHPSIKPGEEGGGRWRETVRTHLT